MLNKHVFFRTLVLVLSILTGFTLNISAQEAVSAGGLLEPVFPNENSALIYIEGEDAVSTNFANQAVSNYGCSGFRSVQLSRNTGLQAGAAFYAEFVFYAEEDGDYEFWYGGTPPGPADDLNPSYASPFSYSLDDGELKAVYREDIQVIEGYTPSYYWNKISVENLSAGPHRLRIEVSEKRRYDGRYYFYLDSLFFINKEKQAEIAENRPAVFPSVLESTAIDRPFLTINDYKSYIDKNPDDGSALIELSLVYSLLGDYQASLKTLSKAMALNASDPYPIVLAAKNRLWKGDVNESLALYERALSVDPEDNVLWSEAGKVAAWTGNYQKSIDFFTRGMAKFPDDLNIMVNLGLTYLWMSKSLEAEETFATAQRIASEDPAVLKELGEIEEANGYPEYAREVYRLSIDKFPEYLEFYLLLQQSYLASGERESADDVGRLIEKSFIPSEKLDNELEIYQNKLKLRDDVIEVYLAKLREDPGNLELRQELAQTFFWNGMKAEAIEQIKYVITTHSYRAGETFIRRNADLLRISDEAAAFSGFPANWSIASSEARKKVSSTASELKRAVAAAEAAAEAEDGGKPEVADELRAAEQAFADAVSEALYLADLRDDMEEGVEALDAEIKAVLEQEKTEDEAFRSVVRSSGWTWDRSFLINELTAIMAEEPQLASCMLGLARFAAGEFRQAVEILTPQPEEEEGSVIIETAEEAAPAEDSDAAEPVAVVDYSALPADMLYALYQAQLLGGDEQRTQLVKAESERLYAGYPHLEAVESEIEFGSIIGKEDGLYSPPAGVYYEGLHEESAAAIEVLSEYEKEARNLQQKIDRILNQQSAVIGKRLERANYYLEADTYLIRYELGNYYLDEGLNKEAATQFRRVITVDPWNISATYKLGIVEQRYGNWSEAMKYYKKVYLQDPTYENAVFYYNQLERQNADTVSAGFQMTSTPAEISYLAELDYSTNFNSTFGFDFSYDFDQQRRYRAYSGEETGYFQIHEFEAGVPVAFSPLGLEIKPRAGVYVENLFYKTDYSISADILDPLSFLSSYSVYPKFGASASWNWNILDIDAAWDYSIEADTFYPNTDYEVGKQIITQHDITLNIATWFDFDDVDFLGPLTTRTYGELQILSDDNIKGQVYQEMLMGFTLANSPVIKLFPGLSFNYENSKNTTEYGYYTPKGVIEAKGSLRSVFTFPSADWSSAFEGALWGAGGGYWSNVGVEGEEISTYVKAEGGLGLTFVKNSNTYTLNLSGLATFDESGVAYWEITVALDTVLKLPGLLTP